MAHKDYKPEDIMYPSQHIVNTELVKEMQKSFIEYAMSVIVERALPDVRDGLKPVHRRILYAMYEDGLTRDKPYRKCATAVGDVLGRYHPHGDASVYDALVRLAQDFSMRYPLIDGHGNFGSIDGDPPAAYRYTEARMSRISDEMLRDIEKETVDWSPNFDETRKEPRVLPSRFPNLLVNGSSGIAVGMATNIPPHNLREVIGAAICLLDNPEATLDELMQHIKGPDFPTRGIIMGRSGIRQAYETGRGRIIVRARCHFEEYGKDKRERIIVTELPYQVNKRMLIASIADLVKDKRIEGISDLRDETDRTGMRIVIETKKDANVQVVLNHLYTMTSLQTSFAINMLALVDDQTQPRILSLRHILSEYIKFQEELIVRRTRFDLRKAEERAHILEGLLIAEENIDAIIKTIRESYDDAKENLMAKFNLSDPQASAILEMRLKQLQGLDRLKLEEEYKALEAKIADFKDILANPERVKQTLKEEMTVISDKYGDDRYTEIQDSVDDIDDEDLIERHDCVITMTCSGYIKRNPVDTYSAQNRGGKGIVGMTTKEEDAIKDVMVVHSHSYLLMFTSAGKVYMKKAYQIPEASRTAKGTNLVNVLELAEGEKVTSIVSLNGFDDDEYFVMVTKKGVIKRASTKDFEYQRKGGKIAINLDEGDELLAVKKTEGESDIIIATRKGKAVRFDEKDARVMGRTARGVRGIRLKGDDDVVGVSVVEEGKKLITITEKGFGKRNDFDCFSAHSRGTMGVICHKLTAKTGELAGIAAVSEDDDIMVITNEGTIIRMAVSSIPVYGSGSTSGVIVMRLDGEAKIVNFAVTKSEKEEETENTEGETAAEAVSRAEGENPPENE
ncbi:MAG: DNA gyrase subunit A [Eubacteriales bacterium]|nr:DNA gyrase subunit A [Eubacterium sp.]MDY5493259.1 DNA gyrase subunit A [Eubacteriales bacterium]